MKKLTKRQKAVFDEYSTDEWVWITGVDYRTVLSLVNAGLLDYDHINAKVKKHSVENPIYKYSFVATSGSFPVSVVKKEYSYIPSEKEFVGVLCALRKAYKQEYGSLIKDIYVDFEGTK